MQTPKNSPSLNTRAGHKFTFLTTPKEWAWLGETSIWITSPMNMLFCTLIGNNIRMRYRFWKMVKGSEDNPTFQAPQLEQTKLLSPFAFSPLHSISFEESSWFELINENRIWNGEDIFGRGNFNCYQISSFFLELQKTLLRQLYELCTLFQKCKYCVLKRLGLGGGQQQLKFPFQRNHHHFQIRFFLVIQIMI